MVNPPGEKFEFDDAATMNILVLGASGLVGSHLVRAAKAAGHDVSGTYFNYYVPGLLHFGLDDIPTFENLLHQVNPDAVVCSAAWVWADGCQRNPQRALSLNRDFPGVLADTTHRFGSQFVFLSTNYVFNGEDGPYSENDIPAPINVYGRSKLSGERDIIRLCKGEAIIVRTAGVYGEEYQGKNFLYQVVRNLSAGRLMKVPYDQVGNATYAGDLAAGILKLIDGNHEGVWNLAGPDPNLSRNNFAIHIAHEYGLEPGLIESVPSSSMGQFAPRPRQAGLVIDKARAAIGFNPSQWTKIDIKE